jgi:restriction endonuclease S subunit
MYSLDSKINTDSAFLIKRSLIESRLEPKFYTKKYIDNIIKVRNSNYQVFSLSEVTDLISDGTHFTPNYVNKGVKFISVKDVRKSKIDFNNTKYISVEEADKLDGRCKPQINDVLLTKIGATFGFASTVDTNERFQIFVSLALLRPKSNILPKYLEIFLNSDLAYTQYERVIKGAGVPDLHLEDIRKIKIPLPTLEQQERIVSTYQIAFDQKKQKEAEAKKLFENIDTYLLAELGIKLPKRDSTYSKRTFKVKWSEVSGDRFDSEYSQLYFIELSNAIKNSKFKTVKVKEVTAFVESGSRPQGGVGRISTGVFSIGGEHVNNKCQVGNGKPKYIPLEFHEKIKLTETKLHDIILVKDGATTGKIGIIDNVNFVNQNINEHVFLIRPKTNIISPYFLLSILYSSIGQILLKRFITGATVTGLTKESLRKIEIPLPTIDIQKKITTEIFSLRERANQLEADAKYILVKAKQEIEKMVIGSASN